MSPSPSSVIISREIMPGRAQEFEATLKEVTQAITDFKGYLSTHVLYPSGDSTAYRIHVNFDNEENLHHWENSDEKRYWVDKLDSFNASPSQRHIITGLETWFALPRCESIVPPKRYKMAVVTWLAITPTLISFKYFISPYLSKLPLIPAIGITTACMVSAMTYIIMPYMTKFFNRWLYPTSK